MVSKAYGKFQFSHFGTSTYPVRGICKSYIMTLSPIGTANVKYGLWVHTSAKHGRVKSLNFPKIGLSVDLPVALQKSRTCIRAIQTTYDHVSLYAKHLTPVEEDSVSKGRLYVSERHFFGVLLTSTSCTTGKEKEEEEEEIYRTAVRQCWWRRQHSAVALTTAVQASEGLDYARDNEFDQVHLSQSLPLESGRPKNHFSSASSHHIQGTREHLSWINSSLSLTL